jgi:serine/threonine-protein kinase RsbW
MTGAETRFVLDSNAAEVPDLQAKLLAWCGETGIDGSAAAELTLAIVEAVNNSIEHAYTNEPGHPIALRCLRDRDNIVIEIRDRGELLCQRPENPAMPEWDKPGGRGWAIICHSTDTATCRREGNENVLTLTRQL